MDKENLQDFTNGIRSFLREIQCYDSQIYEDGGRRASNAVTQLEKAIIYQREENLALQARVENDAQRMEKLQEVCKAALEHLNYAPISYANGNICNGIDEGEVIGGNAHRELTKQLEAAIGGE